MKALTLVEYNEFEFGDVSEPEPGPEDVLVEVKACGICGSDVHGMDGSTGRRRPPVVMGHEASGEIVKVNNNLVGINTLLTNKIVFESLNQKKIKDLIQFNNIKSEVKFSDNTRFDFLISNNRKKCFLEIKNVTLLRKNKIAEFPDAITSRGAKHLKN